MLPKLIENLPRSARNLPRTSWSTIESTHLPHTHPPSHANEVPDRKDPKQGAAVNRPLAAFNESGHPSRSAVLKKQRSKERVQALKLQPQWARRIPPVRLAPPRPLDLSEASECRKTYNLQWCLNMFDVFGHRIPDKNHQDPLEHVHSAISNMSVTAP